MTLVFFNLLANASFSLLVGLIVVGFFVWLFRVEAGPWKVFLLSLPFVKVVYDVIRGLPADSVLYGGVDLFALPPKHQSITLNGGFSPWGPSVNLVFQALGLDGHLYTSSIGDYIAIWVYRTLGPDAPLLILAAVTAIAGALLSIRFAKAIKFEEHRSADRANAKNFRQVALPFRTVDIYLSEGFTGTPFTGGIFRPYICIPVEVAEQLSPEELESVIQHELGHVNRFDVAVTMAIYFLGDVFWFVPGYRWLARKIDNLREIVADQWAVHHGAEPAFLASALVKLKEIPDSSDKFVLYSAFLRKKPLLKTPIENLVGSSREAQSRLGWRYVLVRVVVTFWIFMAVMLATFGGNHQTIIR